MMERPSTAQNDPRPPEQAWERMGSRFAGGMPFATLAAALLLTWLQPEVSWQHRLQTLLLSALAAAWVYLMYTRACPNPWEKPLRMLAYFGGFLALAGALMAIQPIFFLFTVTGFLHAAVLRPWPLVFLGVGLTSTLINTVITGFPWPERETWVFYGALIAFQTAATGLGILFVENVSRLSDERRQAVARLEAALEENAGLQAQLVNQAREAGILEERQRLAREIHDTLAQGLTGIITQLGAVEQAQEDPRRRQRHLELALRLARESLAEARRSVHALQPGPLVGVELSQAIAQVAEEWSRRHGISAEVTVTGDPLPLRPEAEAALLRTAQEALANITRHAQAARAGLTLSYMGDMVALDIRDDGIGFDPSAAGTSGGEGFGLDAMRQRIERIGGTLEIESEPGGGTAVSARLPVREASQEPAAP